MPFSPRQTQRAVGIAQRGVVDAVRLRRDRPELAAALDVAPPDWIRAAYTQYVATVSTAEMAVSLQTACALHALAVATRPRVVADLGSGFSSFVLGRWSAENGATVRSFDDDRRWAEKSETYLAAHDLNLVVEPIAEADQLSDADLVFLDLNLTTRRIGYLHSAVSSLSPHGLLVVDDLHHYPFGKQVRVAHRYFGAKLYSLRRWTQDDFGRFSGLVVGGH